MLKMSLCFAALFAFTTTGLLAQAQTDKTKAPTDKTADATKETKTTDGKMAKSATITKMDAKKGTVTVSMKDKDGKDHDRTFTLTEDVRMVDENGRVAAMDVFRSGNEVLIVEAEGRLRELHKQPQASTNKTTGSDKK